jgi:molybdopterin-guanine dinucleotide biosynthesis protein A
MMLKLPYQNYPGAILSGGTNSRFNGRIKSLVPFHNKPILEHQTEVLKSLFPEIMLITNYPNRFSDYRDISIYTDVIPGKGPLSGIHTALKKSTGNSIFVVAGDMPFINIQTISEQIEIAEKHKCDAVIPKIGQDIEPLHGIYHKSGIIMLETILQTENNPSVRQFLNQINTYYWEVKNNQPFININTLEELNRYEESEHHKNKRG